MERGGGTREKGTDMKGEERKKEKSEKRNVMRCCRKIVNML
jgi:hypothetical protein